MVEPKVWRVGEPVYGWQLMGQTEPPPPATPAQRRVSERIAACFARDAERLRAAHEALLQDEQQAEHPDAVTVLLDNTDAKFTSRKP